MMAIIHLLLVYFACSAALMVHATIIEDEYLVDLNTTLITSDAEQDDFIATITNHFGITLIEILNVGTLRMILISTNSTNAESISRLPQVNLIEPNSEVEKMGVDTRFCHKRAAPKAWGLDRIDQREKLQSADPINKVATLIVGPYRGAGVVAYIGDTGIDINNSEFGNRAFWGYTVPGMDGDIDLNGHGTHVAGTIGSVSYGVASEVILVAVKMLNRFGYGTYSGVIAGMKWILDDHNSRKLDGENAKSVVNFSLGGGAHTCADNTLRQLINAGIIAVAAAGNGNQDACSRSPAGVKEAITVGAIDVTDTTASFTNWGTCVDIFAPGVNVMSTLPNNTIAAYSGTSMATPHVTGIVALKLSRDAKIKTPKEMTAWLNTKATRGAIKFLTTDHETSPDRLLFFNCMV